MLLVALPLVAAARPRPVEAPPTPIDFSVIRAGTGIRIHFEGARFVASDADQKVFVDRQLDASLRHQLRVAALAVLDDPRVARGCTGDESFVTVTIGPKTTSSAVCGPKDPEHPEAADWWALLQLIRTLATPPRPQ